MRDLRVEAFSMIPVRIVDSMITMSKAEIQVTVEEISGRKLTADEVKNLPGTEGPSFSRSSLMSLRMRLTMSEDEP